MGILRIFFFSASNLPQFRAFRTFLHFPHSNQIEREIAEKNAYKITSTEPQREMRKIVHKKYP